MKKTALALCLALALLLPLPAQAFSDVSPDDWYGPAVAAMAEAGILSGYPDGSFRPGEEITAAELVTMTAQCAGLAPVPGQVDHWAAGLLEAALRKGWYDWDEIPPDPARFDAPITRQVAVKIVMGALLPDRRGDYNTGSRKMSDFADLDGRYYESVFAAYAAGVVSGDAEGTFGPRRGLSRAEACIILRNALALRGGQPPAPQPTPEPLPTPAVTRSGGVAENGKLQVIGTQLCNERGDPVVLRGMSTHGLQWFPQYASAQAIQNTAAYGANVFRLAMYTGEGGYLDQSDQMKARVLAAVDAAIENDMYVIVDWHILSDGSPSAHTDQAVAFFGELAQRYADSPNLIWEICNEPNGPATWSGDVKPYAQTVTAAIRQYSDGVILIGSPTWSQDVHLAAADPVAGENLMYTLHFYAGTHGQDLRDRMDAALRDGLPLFVSEWGTSRADGSGGVFLEESALWLDFLEARGISWCNWSLCDKNETSAALLPGAPADAPWTDAHLSPSGAFVFQHF